jgi:glucose-6-phosphate isomerase
MKGITFENKNSLVRTSDFERTKKKLALEITKIKESISKKEKGYDAINLPRSREVLSVLKLAKEKQQLDISAVIVVGIGGSNLGTMAVYEALQGKFTNLKDIKDKKKIFFADTTDSDTIFEIKLQMESILKSGKNVLINLISKSGNTTESIANFEILLETLKKQRKEYRKYIVFTTDKNSALEQLGLKEGFDILNVPQNAGGRYSVLSPVGLFPLAMMSIDVKKLLKGAGSITDKCLSKDISKNPSALSAIDIFCNYREGKIIHDIFAFSNDLESTGKWYRQLLAESLGKKYSRSGSRVNEGITPTVSIGSTDLHSMAQLYLGGPNNTFTTFIKVIPKQKEKIPKMKEYGALVLGIQGKKLSEIMDAIFSGIRIAYIKGGRPFNQLTISKDEYSIGQYLQYEMIKVIMLGHLLNVNPFDQPAVEQYKEETRKILGK